MKVRIKFAKCGAMVFIGHLDMMRYFQKAMRRAGIDISYSQGFNPHQIMSFAAPLGVGLCSNGEYMDIQVESATTSEQMRQALNAVMVEGVEVLSVKRLPDDAQNAMASVAAAGYTVRFREGHEPPFDVREAFEAFREKQQILITKKTKKGEKELDIAPSIYEMRLTDDGIYLLVDASSAGNIKPGLVIQALYEQNQTQLGEFDLLITREDTYVAREEDGKVVYLPLDAIGEDI
ncbi:MAG: TIGR03936 family radical SAM-associated protein [Lachnospiraceae bacterium]|nr:TIGR03936 family radical SAM-associated protein [Lachnospiraceae bacterium]